MVHLRAFPELSTTSHSFLQQMAHIDSSPFVDTDHEMQLKAQKVTKRILNQDDFFFHTCYCLLLVVADVHLKCLLCQQPLTENHLEADGRPQRGSDTEAVYDGLAER